MNDFIAFAMMHTVVVNGLKVNIKIFIVHISCWGALGDSLNWRHIEASLWRDHLVGRRCDSQSRRYPKQSAQAGPRHPYGGSEMHQEWKIFPSYISNMYHPVPITNMYKYVPPCSFPQQRYAKIPMLFALKEGKELYFFKRNTGLTTFRRQWPIHWLSWAT